jgi:hypothetical protein
LPATESGIYWHPKLIVEPADEGVFWIGIHRRRTTTQAGVLAGHVVVDERRTLRSVWTAGIEGDLVVHPLIADLLHKRIPLRKRVHALAPWSLGGAHLERRRSLAWGKVCVRPAGIASGLRGWRARGVRTVLGALRRLGDRLCLTGGLRNAPLAWSASGRLRIAPHRRLRWTLGRPEW